MSIAQVIGWKFNHQSGMRCKTVGGILTIVDFPGGIPTEADQLLWTDEYNTWLLANPPLEPLSVEDLFDLLVSRNILNASDRPTRP